MAGDSRVEEGARGGHGKSGFIFPILTGRVPIVWAEQANGGCSAATPMEMTSACIGHDVVATAADTGRPLDFAWPQGRSNL